MAMSLLGTMGALAMIATTLLNASSAMLAGVVSLGVAAMVLWFVGLEIVGWITLTLSVGAIAVLFVFVLMLTECSPRATMSLGSLAMGALLSQLGLSALVVPSTPLFAGSPALALPTGLEYASLGMHMTAFQAHILFGVALILTLGLFAVPPADAITDPRS